MFNVWRLVKAIALLCPYFCQSSGRTGRTDLLKWWAACNHHPAFEHYLFQSTVYVSTYQLDRGEHCRHAFQLASIHINPDTTNLRRSASLHLICIQFGFPWAGSRTDGRKSKQSFFDFPMSARTGFQLMCRFLGRKLGISSLWRCSSCVSLVSVSLAGRFSHSLRFRFVESYASASLLFTSTTSLSGATSLGMFLQHRKFSFRLWRWCIVSYFEFAVGCTKLTGNVLLFGWIVPVSYLISVDAWIWM